MYFLRSKRRASFGFRFLAKIEMFTHADEISRELRGSESRARRMLQILARLIDHVRNREHARLQIWDAFFRRMEIARDQKIRTVGQALVANERVPIGVFQFLSVYDATVDAVLENAKIDIVGLA